MRATITFTGIVIALFWGINVPDVYRNILFGEINVPDVVISSNHQECFDVIVLWYLQSLSSLFRIIRSRPLKTFTFFMNAGNLYKTVMMFWWVIVIYVFIEVLFVAISLVLLFYCPIMSKSYKCNNLYFIVQYFSVLLLIN